MSPNQINFIIIIMLSECTVMPCNERFANHFNEIELNSINFSIDFSHYSNIFVVFVTEIAERIKVSDKGDISDEDDTRIAEHFPTFIWTLRDFVLQLEFDGKAVTSDGYLEKALEMKPGQ